MNTDNAPASKNPTPRRRWVRPTLTSLGTLAQILQGGGSKQSVTRVDSGDPYKPKGSA